MKTFCTLDFMGTYLPTCTEKYARQLKGIGQQNSYSAQLGYDSYLHCMFPEKTNGRKE